MITVTKKVHIGLTARRKRIADERPATQTIALGRIPRVSKVMALALKFEKLLRDGTIATMDELAQLAKVTQPRITQILNLAHLAPDIIEDLLFLPRVMEGRDPIHEKMLRPVIAELSWAKQRASWSYLKRRIGMP